MNTGTANKTIIWRKGKRVILRPIEESDIPYFRMWINNPLNSRFLGVTWPVTDIAERDWYERSNKNGPDKITVAVCLDDGTLIGSMGLEIDPYTQSATTGSLIGHFEYQSKGYGTDAKMLLLDHAFNWRGVRKVTSKILTHNGRSQSYAKKCGYRLMATIEKEHFRQGIWQDEVQYVVFRDEWLPLWEDYTSDWTPPWEESGS